MTVWRANRWTLVLGSLLVCVVVMPVGTTSAQEKDLSGGWVIDADESNDPAEVLERLTGRPTGQGGVGIGVGIFGVPVEVARTAGRGNEPEEVVRRDLRRLRQHLINAVDQLEIEQSPESLRVAYDDLGTLVYGTGKTTEEGDVVTLAEWRRDVYTVLRHIGNELLATEELYLDRTDPSRLHWLVSVELSSRRAFQIHRVYDRAPQP
jgi:hypothetical protein